MRILANLAFVVPGGVGGTEQYSVRLLEALLAAHRRDGQGDQQDQANQACEGDQGGPGIDDGLVVAGHRSLFAAHPSLARFEHRAFAGPVGLRPYRLAVESTWLARQSRGAELVHHFGGRAPAVRVGRSVLTIHDLQHLDLPGNVHPVKRRYLRWAIDASLRSAALVCTPSAWVKGRLIEHYRLPDERVRVVSSTAAGGLGAQADPLPGAAAGDTAGDAAGAAAGDVAGEAAARIAAEIGERQVVLYPALTHPHKNHETLIDAVARLRRSRPDLLLILTGAPGRSAAQVAAQIRAVDPEGRFVRHLGRVPAVLLAELMRRADVLAFPSRYEGFGLPVLEAMQAGTPVLAADATALPEVAGDAAILVDPEDVDAWSAGIESLLGDESRRRELAEAGRARAEAYSPQAAAAALRAVWRDALS